MEALLSEKGSVWACAERFDDEVPALPGDRWTSFRRPIFLLRRERKRESFATFIANKEVAKQDMENHLQERLNEKLAGRVLLRQAKQLPEGDDCSQGQRGIVDIRSSEFHAMLRRSDKPEMMAQAAGAELGSAASKHYPVSGYDKFLEEDKDDCDQDAPGDTALASMPSKPGHQSPRPLLRCPRELRSNEL